jgi:ABC-type Fe2+-enterobactin transport system substrate-binding protein
MVIYMNKSTQLLAGFIGMALGALILVGLVDQALDRATHFECHAETVVVNYGDTLWGIASENCTGHTGHATHQIAELNNGSTIQIGEVIHLP